MSDDDFSKRVASLPAEKRELLEIFLKQKQVDSKGLESEYAAPRNPAEETLAEIWSQVLNVERVGIHDNFFKLGGDSILSIQIIAKAAQAGLTLTSNQDLFERPTIAELAEVVEEGTLEPAAAAADSAPGDFPEAELSPEELARILSKDD